jgi:hypothetical protein
MACIHGCEVPHQEIVAYSMSHVTIMDFLLLWCNRDLEVVYLGLQYHLKSKIKHKDMARSNNFGGRDAVQYFIPSQII